MKQQFILADCYVDLTRNQIRRDEVTEILPPKAMAVLACLVEHQGQVISNDKLLETVWPDTVVSPNTLQRSITQLRKALGDDSKQQNIIQTHAKQGYSLELAISEVNVDKTQNHATAEPAKTTRINTLVAAVMGLMVVLALGFGADTHQNETPNFQQISTLTATDAKESAPEYSPDGRYIVFHRFAGLCANNIWAKERASGREIQLTGQYGIYGDSAFSPDGKQLVFRARETCPASKPITRQTCWQLMTINFESALNAPQMPTLRASCEAEQMDEPHWMSNGTIAVLQQREGQWQLVSYKPGESTAKTLYSPQDKYLYATAYSTVSDTIALLVLDEQGRHLLEILNSEGELIDSNVLSEQTPFARLRRISLNFHPQLQEMVFSSGKQIYRLSMTGEVSPLRHTVNTQLYHPNWHPDSSALVAISGIFDSDFALTSLDATPKVTQQAAFNEVSTPFPSIDRSIVDDKDALFQPGGELTAYLSMRSSDNQLWLYDGKTSRQLTDLPENNHTNGFAWHPSGDSIIFSSNNRLQQVWLDGTQQKIDFAHPVLQLYQIQPNGSLLLSANIEGKAKLLSFNPADGTITVHSTIETLWAAALPDDEFILLDANRKYHRITDGKSRLIDKLADVKTAKRFSLDGNLLYNIGNDGRLWSYDVTIDKFQQHQKLHPYVSYISDIKDGQMLLTQLVSVKKEVVEFRQ